MKKYILTVGIIGVLVVGVLVSQSQYSLFQAVRLFGEAVSYSVRLDPSTHAILYINYEHHEVHDGNAYHAINVDADLDNTDTLAVTFKTPNTTKWIHILYEVEASAIVTICVYESPTITAGTGTDSTAINRNRNSSNTSGVLSHGSPAVANKVTFTPEITAMGVPIYKELIGGTGIGNSNFGGSGGRGTNEFVLKQNTDYAFCVLGNANDGRVTIRLDWYEHTDRD